MTRLPDWPERLARFVEARRSRPFRWGENDCALFAADWVREATGRDPAAAFRGRYATAAGAVRALKRYGAGDLIATWTALEGAPLESPRLAQRGDVVAVESGEGAALSICLDERIAVVTPDGGLGFLPLSAAVVAWRV